MEESICRNIDLAFLSPLKVRLVTAVVFVTSNRSSSSHELEAVQCLLARTVLLQPSTKLTEHPLLFQGPGSTTP